MVLHSCQILAGVSDATYCSRVSREEYARQSKDCTREALVAMMNDLLDDTKATLKEKKQRLKQFQKCYPTLYEEHFSGMVWWGVWLLCASVCIKQVLHCWVLRWRVTSRQKMQDIIMHSPTVQCLWLGGTPPPPAMFCLLNWGKGCCPFDLLVWAYSHNRCRLWNHRLVFWNDRVKGDPKQWEKLARKCKTANISTGRLQLLVLSISPLADLSCSVDISTWRLKLLVLSIFPPEDFSYLFCRYLHLKT